MIASGWRERPMRVLLLYKDYHPVVGGIENHIRLLARGLRNEGVDASVLVTNTGPATQRQTIDGVPVTKTGRQATILSTPISLPFFVELRRQMATVDLVHLHAPYPLAELAQLMLGRAKPTVISYHSDIVRQKKTAKLYAPFLKKVLQRAALVAASSPAYIESSPFLQDVRQKCRVIHYGIETERFEETEQVRGDAESLRNQYGDLPLLLFIGRLRHYKGCRRVNPGHARHPRPAVDYRDRSNAGGMAESDAGGKPDRQSLLLGRCFGEGNSRRALCRRPVRAAVHQSRRGPGNRAAGGDGLWPALSSARSSEPAHPMSTATVLRVWLSRPTTRVRWPWLSTDCSRAPALRAKMGVEGRRRVKSEFSLQEMINATISFYEEALREG